MSFQAYIDNIYKKTGKTPEEFKNLADKEGLLQPGVKARTIVAWLKRDFGLGHGHASHSTSHPARLHDGDILCPRLMSRRRREYSSFN